MVDVLGFTYIVEETCGVDFVFVEPVYISLYDVTPRRHPGLDCGFAGVRLAAHVTPDNMELFVRG